MVTQGVRYTLAKISGKSFPKKHSEPCYFINLFTVILNKIILTLVLTLP